MDQHSHTNTHTHSEILLHEKRLFYAHFCAIAPRVCLYFDFFSISFH